MDKLDHIFELQKGFQDKLKRERGLEGIPMETWLQKQTLAMISELAELLEEVNFKWWKNPHELRPDCVREELSDILHFFVSMCIEAGMTARRPLPRLRGQEPRKPPASGGPEPEARLRGPSAGMTAI